MATASIASATREISRGKGRGKDSVLGGSSVPNVSTISSQSEGTSEQTQPEMPSRRVISTDAKVTKRSDIVTGDIRYTPRQGFKWKGKSAITNSKLERMRAENVIQTRSAAAAKTQGKNSSTRKTHVP
ncbi:hypothetical protein FXO38_02754 [Capsicum annuum]|nr:hypothetical protein FXO38_02754 [Capsicum annuum]KAF3681564.1 hypothetical protein FXO37_02844 [Capsicum annuum]